MAKIQSVDYMAMPQQAREMRIHGKDINTQITAAYQVIRDMHKAWYGKRYNALVGEFNKIIPNLNALLQLVVGDIPFALLTVANNYAMADRGGKIVGASQEAPTKITEISASNEEGMRFMEEDVTNAKAAVTKYLQNAVDLMNNIDTDYKKITWQSEAADAFRNQFTTLKNNIVKSFMEIRTSFSNLMEQTQADIHTTENANTVSQVNTSSSTVNKM